jgi:hypothetical protein
MQERENLKTEYEYIGGCDEAIRGVLIILLKRPNNPSCEIAGEQNVEREKQGGRQEL